MLYSTSPTEVKKKMRIASNFFWDTCLGGSLFSYAPIAYEKTERYGTALIIHSIQESVA